MNAMNARKIYSTVFALLTLAGSIGFFVVEHFCNSCMSGNFEISIFTAADKHHHHGDCTNCTQNGETCECHHKNEDHDCSSEYFSLAWAPSQPAPEPINLWPQLRAKASMQIVEACFTDNIFTLSEKLLPLPPLLNHVKHTLTCIMTFRL